MTLAHKAAEIDATLATLEAQFSDFLAGAEAARQSAMIYGRDGTPRDGAPEYIVRVWAHVNSASERTLARARALAHDDDVPGRLVLGELFAGRGDGLQPGQKSAKHAPAISPRNRPRAKAITKPLPAKRPATRADYRAENPGKRGGKIRSI